jgi:hypothetical protein
MQLATRLPPTLGMRSSSLLKKSDGFEMFERKESGWDASRINRSVQGGLNQTCVAPWAEYLFQQTASTRRPPSKYSNANGVVIRSSGTS